MTPRVQPATAAHLAGVAAVFNDYLGVGSMALSPRTAADYRPLLDAPRAALLVAVDATDRVYGYASVKPWSEREGYVLAAEVSVFLAQSRRRYGLGTRLYKQLFRVAHRLGYRYLAARIMADNRGSIAFHEHHGFSRVGVQRGIGLIDGRRLDNVLMERHLAESGPDEKPDNVP